ncbi:hypothetical protein AMTRI_Chr05g71380 [Amborella trichopoda]|uniref:NB-ARC domain-containing protein n=1 Tax=Amborella trichopoda TaxID=13333 RepID=W1PA80_AMBTC|nr:uncharacterized protein LOC18432675 [Amborella trichopoda]XP_020521974.1 uncharacterized protein LOC18432675 [Amborella trichopoda]XP_020521975.1 uncharacterized protein LOC18432675 [Amborella trichopoda]XP_020521976.1 uncharacterized protein LOC18432675 [Amborella trichopoda]ERN04516.1 hypothetical protein AMTR_s00081p00125870 [Amborella trichopoda]|eukprot:XP_006842841.1 uncharacterized protein LOC18432675 [Amborella trichopoda]
MDALQIVSSATQIVSSMIGAVGALEQASRNLDEAPGKIRSLEEFMLELENLVGRVKQRHAQKLHNPQLENQIHSLHSLIERLQPNVRKVKKIVSKSKVKNLASVVWGSMVGDPLSKSVFSIRQDLNHWLELQQLTEDIERAIDSKAKSVPLLFKISSDKGYPISKKSRYVKSLLEQEKSHKVVLIVGLSGIGKSCLARQVASDPPKRFIHGAIELSLGQWCSRTACDGSKSKYRKRLAKKISRFLVQIGCDKKILQETNGDLDDVCDLLQETLVGKSILVFLDDVWEQDIVDRFAKLYGNDCKYLVTSRNEAVYEITEAEKVEISKDDVREISKAILLHHTLLTEEELPDVGERLLERCGHHPLTIAVMGKALRKETRLEKWENAINNLSTYATCAPGPVSYVNEKEAENAVTVFGSFEFSLEAMPAHSKRLFIALAAVYLAEPVPEACLEALWYSLGQASVFSLVVCKLVEGSLLIKDDSYPMYYVHDMVSLYFDSKVDEAVNILLTQSSSESAASVAPWLFAFGKEKVKIAAEEKLMSFLSISQERLGVVTLEAIVNALMASKSVSDLEASSASFRSIIGPRIVELISIGSPYIRASAARCMVNIFSRADYRQYHQSLEDVCAIDKLANLLENCDNPVIQTDVSGVLAKLAEYGSQKTVNKVLLKIPMNKLAELLDPDAEEWHDSLFTTLMSLAKAGKSKAVERMFASGIDKKLIKLLESGSEVTQHHAMVALKSFYELGGTHASDCLRPGTLNLLPWQARLSLEKFTLLDRNVPMSPKPHKFEDIVRKMQEKDSRRVMEAMQELISFFEKANQPKVREMILLSPLIGKLVSLLQYGNPDGMRSESAFLLMKLSCFGGAPCIRKMLDYDTIQALIKMMHCNVEDLQDSAYTSVHEMLFGEGGPLLLNQILRTGQIEKLVHSLNSKSIKTKEVSLLCLQDLVEVGSKACIDKIFSLQVIEKIALDKNNSKIKDIIVNFVKGLDKCKNLSSAERRVLKQQIIRKVRASVRGHKQEAHIIAAVDGSVAEGSRMGSSKHRK